MLFEYKALKDNQVIEKKIDAENERAVVNYLKENGYFPISVRPQRKLSLDFLKNLGTPLDKVTKKDIVDITRQLAIMTNAGLTIIDSLAILKKQIKKKRLLTIITVIDEQIRAGNSLSSSLAMFSDNFSSMYISLVKAGEASGKLGEILLKLAENLEKDRQIKSKLKSALVYPAVIVAAMVAVMFIMLTFVFPKLLTFYKEFNVALPLSTQILISFSTFSSRFWPLIIAAVVGIVIFLKRYIKTKQGRYFIDSFILKIPVLSNIFKMATLVDSTRTLALLVGAGVSILESLRIIIETTDNVVFQASYRNVLKNVEKGVSLGDALRNEEVFPPIFPQMAIVGDNTGRLDDTLLRLSKYFEIESEIAIKTMTTLVEPAVLIVLGLGIGFLVVSVITPIYNFTSSIK